MLLHCEYIVKNLLRNSYCEIRDPVLLSKPGAGIDTNGDRRQKKKAQVQRVWTYAFRYTTEVIILYSTGKIQFIFQ